MVAVRLRIGTQVHALMPGGNCAFGFITRWDPARQLADLALFPGGMAEDGLTALMRLPNGFPHVEQPGPLDELTFHLAEACPWNR